MNMEGEKIVEWFSHFALLSLHVECIMSMFLMAEAAQKECVFALHKKRTLTRRSDRHGVFNRFSL